MAVWIYLPLLIKVTLAAKRQGWSTAARVTVAAACGRWDHVALTISGGEARTVTLVHPAVVAKVRPRKPACTTLAADAMSLARLATLVSAATGLAAPLTLAIDHASDASN